MNLPRLAHPLPRSATGLINRLRALDVYPASAWSGVAGQRHADGELDLYPRFPAFPYWFTTPTGSQWTCAICWQIIRKKTNTHE
jgi:hypothetical protein